MFEKVKKSIAAFVIKRRYLRKDTKPVNFNNFFNNAKSILVIFPENQEHIKEALNVFSFINTPSRKILIVVSDVNRSRLNLGVANKIISYTMEQKSFLKLPNSSLLNNICETRFDVVIDLNLDENMFTSMISAAADAVYKVGFSDQKLENLFNFQLGRNKIDSNINYKNLVDSLQMF